MKHNNSLVNIFLSITTTILFFLFIEYFVLKILDKYNFIDAGISLDWIDHNKKINDTNYNKILLKNGNGFDYVINSKYRSQDLWRTKFFKENDHKITQKRILVMGDSFVWGDGYANMNDIWWRKLKKQLNKRGYYDIEIIARGQNGWTTKQQLLAIKQEKLIEKYKPDAVIFGYVSNDPDEQLVKIFSCKAPFFEDKFGLNKILPRISIALKHFFCEFYVLNYNDETGYPYDQWLDKILTGNNFDKYKITIAEVSEFIKKQNIPIFFVNLDRSDLNYPVVEKIFKENNIKFYNIHNEFSYLYNFLYNSLNNFDQRAIFNSNPYNGHPGVIVNEFATSKVVDILEKNYSNALPIKNSPSKIIEPLINDSNPIEIEIIQNSNSKQFEVSWNYNKIKNNLLSKPFGKKYIQLNFSNPIDISKIEIIEKSDNIKSLEIGFIRSRDMNVNKIHKTNQTNNSYFINDSSIESLIIHSQEKTSNNKDSKIKIVVK